MEQFEELVQVVRKIREQCPWDSVQTHESLIECLKNETEEVIEGVQIFVENGDSDNLCEELGDLLFLILLNSVIAEEEGAFSMSDMMQGISEKMRFRHPRIFAPGDEELNSLSWTELKKREKAIRKNRKK